MEITQKTIVSEDYSVGQPHMAIVYVVTTKAADYLFEDDDEPEFMFQTQLEAMAFSQLCLKDSDQALEAFDLEFDVQVLDSIDQFNVFECLVFFDDYGNMYEVDDNCTTLVGSVYVQAKDNSEPA